MSAFRNLPLHKASHTPLTPLRFLDRAERYHGERIGLISGEESWTWAEIAVNCRRLASALRARGVMRGDTVSVLAPNGRAIFEAHFGVPMAGAVLNNINVRIEAATLAYILDHAETSVLLVDVEFAGLAREALKLTGRRPLVVDIADPRAPVDDRCGSIEYDALLAEGDPDARSNEPADELQPISLNYTSGTTGQPKGVVYDHRNAFVESMGNLVSWSVTGQPRQLWVVPIFHANGWCYLWPMAALGATNVIVRKPSGREVLDMIARHKCTHVCAAPVIADMMARVPEADRPSFDHKVRMLTAGAPPSAANFASLERMGIDLEQGYGLTEVWGPAIFGEGAPERAALDTDARADLKVRQGIPNLVCDDVIIVDPETMQPVPRDGQTMGEVLFRGNMVMRGYLKDPDATEQAFAGDYFHSGDLAVWHPNGEIQLKDRSKDIIISGGENISSIEIENVIAGHPAVAGVAVIGAPHTRWGEAPWAFVELREAASATADDIIAHCRVHLVGFKIPVGVTFGPIERTATGKVQKFRLRQLLGEMAS